jgi:hypothetical protein
LEEKFVKYEKWMHDWWQQERTYRTKWLEEKNSNVKITKTMTLYATQYNAATSFEVAMPDQYVKFANLGWWDDIPSGYRPQYLAPPYQVNLVNGSYSQTNVPSKDAGPWNKNDNYWDGATSTNPRRLFADLPRYTPEAQAAYYDGYNNGKDGYGHTVLNPAGIDLCLTVASNLGFSSSGSGWIQVTINNFP